MKNVNFGFNLQSVSTGTTIPEFPTIFNCVSQTVAIIFAKKIPLPFFLDRITDRIHRSLFFCESHYGLNIHFQKRFQNGLLSWFHFPKFNSLSPPGKVFIAIHFHWGI